MMSVFSGVSDNKRERWLRGFARIGLGAHGVVYCLMSVLSMMAAMGYRDESADKTEVFKAIYQQPFGQGILFLIGFSLLGYVLLRFFQAFKDTRHKGKRLKGILHRIGCFFIGLGYLVLSCTCFSLALKNGDGDGEKKAYIARLMQNETGTWLVGIVGLVLAGAGVYQVWRGITRQFMRYVDLHDSKSKEIFQKIGCVGHVARGVVFCIIGGLLVRAAFYVKPDEAESTDGAFDFIKANFGAWVMVVVSLGLFAYGVFMLVRSRHEKMNFDQ